MRGRERREEESRDEKREGRAGQWRGGREGRERTTLCTSCRKFHCAAVRSVYTVVHKKTRHQTLVHNFAK